MTCPSEFASVYMVCALPREHPSFHDFAVTVEWRGSMFPDRLDVSWAVCWRGRCADKHGEWDYEPRPSSRTDEWIASHRFSVDEALRIARALAPDVVVNGWTPAMMELRP